MNDELRAKLTIASKTLSAAYISELLAVKADSSQVLGEINKLNTKAYSHHVWRLKESCFINGPDIEEQLQACIARLLSRVTQVRPVIRGLSVDHMVEVGLYICASEMPSISLSAKHVEAIAALGASMDIDVVLYV